ncbi:MAG: hypothetical protein WD604_03760 [Balneolaceae bacterium]
MFIRWLHKLWKFFWISLAVVLATALLVVFLATVMFQLPQSRTFLKNEITSTFNRQFEGDLVLQDIEGFLPFRPEITGGEVYAPSDTENPVLRFERASVRVSWWELLRQNLSIDSFELEKPFIQLRLQDDQLNLLAAFKQREDAVERSLFDAGSPRLFNQLNIFAPSVTIIDGEAYLDTTIHLPGELDLPSPLVIENLNTSVFLEITELQFFADILNLRAAIPGSDYEFIQMEGQFFNDNQYFELNGFHISSAIAELDFNLEASPVNLFTSGIAEQFRKAVYRINLDSARLHPEFITKQFTGFPAEGQPADLELSAEGTMDEMFVERFQGSYGESSIILSADLYQMLNHGFSYHVQLENGVLHPDEKNWLSRQYLNNSNLERYDLSTIRGNLNGNLYETNAELRVNTGSGAFGIDGSLEHEGMNYELLAEVDSLDITPFLNDTSEATVLQGIVAIKGAGTGSQANVNTSLDLSSSTIAGFPVEKLIAELGYASEQYEYSIRAENNEASVRTDGTFRNRNGNYQVTADGDLNNFNLKPYYPEFHADSTLFNSTFSMDLQGSGLNDVFGRISFEMEESMIGADTLRAHQLYADIDSPENNIRTLRFTSSFFDGEVRGTIRPETLQKLGQHWGGFLQERLNEEVLFGDISLFADSDTLFAENEHPVADISVQMNVKDLDLLKYYVPQLPEFTSKARFSTSVNATKERLLVSGTFYDENFDSEHLSIENLNSSLSASFRHESNLKEFTTLDFQLNSTGLSYNGFNFRENYVNLSMRNDSIQVHQRLERLDGNLHLESGYAGILGDNQLEVLINEFDLGTSRYNWQTEGVPRIVFTDREAVIFDKVALRSDSDFLEINGIFSSSYEDSVQYTVRNMNLARISDLIDGRIRFSGVANGQFITRTLGQIPSIQGQLSVENGEINNRTIGDVTLRSELNSEENQFDTEIRVFTDPQKYTDYYVENDSTGQNLLLNGYFKLPDETAPYEDLYYFDAELNEIDMWIVTFIVPGIIEEMEGSSSGTGFIRGGLDDFDFDARFEIIDVYGRPLFTNVGYTLNGELDFNRTEGLIFRDIELTDSRGGYGLLSGQVDLDDFSPTSILDLTLDLNNLHFMNNPYDADIPFYANLYGTGQARVTGTNFDPYLRTTTPVSISSDSRISIPIEDETEFDRDRRFIQFVDSFDPELLKQQRERAPDGNGGDENGETELTFIERFTMDLQFNAENSVNVELVFDRVTNEILSANGTGQIRLLLEDQDVSMFGRFNIEGGNYQFVSGDIFTRRFDLEEGGTINWQGDLAEAGLDVTAIYRARPSISSLTATSSAGVATEESGQRIPIDLVLQIGGSLNAVENNFFFRIPTGFEGTSDPTVTTQINNLNQNEDEKLLQATSILLSGNFIPSDQAQGLGLGDSFSGTAAVVNPLISSQVINPLLSNQINSLLSSDITFDVDFNLNSFNEVDLGVALRLFDDRVILRREGQVTGEQSAIGDLGATYRINRTFSLTAFHRQDPTLTNTSETDTRQTQEMNGLGLEAQVQFNTWQNLRERISNGIRSLFGLKSKDEEHEMINVEENTDETVTEK